MVSDWKLAMLALLLFLLFDSKGAVGPKHRVWLAMFGASLAALYVPLASGFLVIDLLAGALVLKRPAGVAQRCIGLLFAGMAVFDIGYIIGGAQSPGQFVQFMSLIGWLQFTILLLWGLHDRWGFDLHRAGAGRSVRTSKVGRV